MRRGKVYRIPDPPDASDTKALNEWLQTAHTILNDGMQNVQNRLNTVQQTGAQKPPTVTGLTVTGKQGCFYLTWNRIANVDGYSVIGYSDSALTKIVDRIPVPDGDACTLRVAVGNVAVTEYFQVYAYQGPQVSDPSTAVSATTATYGAAEAAPAAPPIAPRPPKVAPIRSGPNL